MRIDIVCRLYDSRQTGGRCAAALRMGIADKAALIAHSCGTPAQVRSITHWRRSVGTDVVSPCAKHPGAWPCESMWCSGIPGESSTRNKVKDQQAYRCAKPCKYASPTTVGDAPSTLSVQVRQYNRQHRRVCDCKRFEKSRPSLLIYRPALAPALSIAEILKKSLA